MDQKRQGQTTLPFCLFQSLLREFGYRGETSSRFNVENREIVNRLKTGNRDRKS
jgi:hypothetical protein